MNTVSILLNLIEKYDEDVRFAAKYGEPGYNLDEGKKGIFLANWNNVPKHIQNGLERRGYEREWCDEWIEADETNTIYRCEPNCYGWKPFYWIREDGTVFGGDEIIADSDLTKEYLESLENNPSTANLFDQIDLEKFGYELVNDRYESGLHPGMNDNPKEILRKALEQEPNVRFIFSGLEPSQFHTTYQLWRKVVQEDQE